MHPPFSSRQSIKFRSGNLTQGAAAAAGAQKLGFESNSSMLRYWRTKHLKKRNSTLFYNSSQTLIFGWKDCVCLFEGKTLQNY